MSDKLPFQILLDLDKKEAPINVVIGSHNSFLTAAQARTAAGYFIKLANVIDPQ